MVLGPFETGYPELIDSNDHTVKRLDHDPLRQQNLLFQRWSRYKNSEIAWSTFQRLARPIRDEFNSSLLLRGRFSGNGRLTGFCNELWPRRHHLWTFLKIEGVDPTNSAVERAAASGCDLPVTELRDSGPIRESLSRTSADGI